MDSKYSFQKSASSMLVLAGVISVPIGFLTLTYPPYGDNNIWGYPYPSNLHIIVSFILVISHMLKAYGFIGLSRLDGATRLTHWSMLIAAFGLVILAICEGVSALLVGVPIESAAAVNLNNGYGAGSMLLAIPSMIGGIAIIKGRLLNNFDRWSVFLSGAFMVFVVTPALFMGRAWPAYLALIGWSLFYIWIGLAMGRKIRSLKEPG